MNAVMELKYMNTSPGTPSRKRRGMLNRRLLKVSTKWNLPVLKNQSFSTL